MDALKAGQYIALLQSCVMSPMRVALRGFIALTGISKQGSYVCLSMHATILKKKMTRALDGLKYKQ